MRSISDTHCMFNAPYTIVYENRQQLGIFMGVNFNYVHY